MTPQPSPPHPTHKQGGGLLITPESTENFPWELHPGMCLLTVRPGGPSTDSLNHKTATASSSTKGGEWPDKYWDQPENWIDPSILPHRGQISVFSLLSPLSCIHESSEGWMLAAPGETNWEHMEQVGTCPTYRQQTSLQPTVAPRTQRTEAKKQTTDASISYFS
jgi:hypothetical protein